MKRSEAIAMMPAHVWRAYFRRVFARLRECSTATAESADKLAAAADKILAERAKRAEGPVNP